MYAKAVAIQRRVRIGKDEQLLRFVNLHISFICFFLLFWGGFFFKLLSFLPVGTGKLLLRPGLNFIELVKHKM